MSDAHDHNPTDEDLVSYLDGELTSDARAEVAQRIAADHALQRRLILLSGGNRPFREAFAVVLDAAPRVRLEAMLDKLPVPKPSAGESPSPGRSWANRTRAVAASLLLFLTGLGAGWLMPALDRPLSGPTESISAEDEWRQAVAEYLTLYTAETLGSIPDNAAVQQQEVAAVGAGMGIALTLQSIALPELSFKRAQLLEYDRKPLGQLAYLDPASGPVALCIFPDDGSDTAQRTEQRQGFNIVYWSRGRHSFMLIGRVPPPRLQELASDVAQRLS